MINFSVKKPYTVIVSVILVIVLGVVSLMSMTPELFPTVELPFALITTSYEDASPEQVELMVTRPIEQSMAAVSNVQEVSSRSSEGRSMITLEFAGDTNMDSALIEVREALDMMEDFLPEAVSSPTILRLNPNMLPVMNVSVSMENQSIEEASSFFEDTILPSLEGIRGVASVSESGLLSSEVNIRIDEDRLADINQEITEAASLIPGADPSAFLLQPDQVKSVIQSQNISAPIGLMPTEEGNFMLRIGEGLDGVSDIEELLVYSNEIIDRDVHLGEIAQVTEDILGQTTYSKVNGEEAVFFTFQKQSDVATTEVTSAIEERLKELEEEHEGLGFTIMMNQGNYINMVVDNIWNNLLVGGGLAILILIIFLRDLRPSVVIGLSIPVSVITALILMYFSGVTLNIISMGGLALGVGMLVDNSIVVFENIYRLRSEGHSAKDAAIAGTKEVYGAIVASTLTTISVFLPIVFTSGLTRQIFVDMGLTIAYSLLASLLIALSFVPMISSKVLRQDIDKKKSLRGVLQTFYHRLLGFSLRHRMITLAFALVIFGLSTYFALLQGVEFFPATNAPELTGTLRTTTDDTDEFVRQLDSFSEVVASEEHIENYGIVTQNMLSSIDTENSASLNLLLDIDHADSIAIGERLTKDAEKLGLTLDIMQNTGDTSALTGGGISIDVSGNDFEEIESLIHAIEERLENVTGITDIDNGIERSAPEYAIQVDKDEALKHGLTIAQIYSQISEPLSRVMPFSQLDFTGEAINMFFRVPLGVELNSLSTLESLELSTPTGETVTLSELANIDEKQGFATIRRQDQRRTLSIKATIGSDETIGIVGERIEEAIKDLEIPQGYQVDLGGELEQINDAFADLALMLGLGILFIYLIMVAQFESLFAPFIVMFTVPLAFTGGFIALLVTGNPISVVAALGFIILAGVIVNNGIVLISYVEQLRERGLEKTEALLKAGENRLRPILMTALTTILGLVPLALGIGGGAELLQPMAITSIGGLLYGTIMTLIVVPCLYSLMTKKDYNID